MLETVVLVIFGVIAFGVKRFLDITNQLKAQLKLAENKARDEALKAHQAFLEKSIKELDDGIAKMKESRKKENNKHKSLAQRAAEARKRYGASNAKRKQNK
jgi:uncharacterized coiled-coil protein SlyX